MSGFGSESWIKALQVFYRGLPPRPVHRRTEIKVAFIRWAKRCGFTYNAMAFCYIVHVKGIPGISDLKEWLREARVTSFGKAIAEYVHSASKLSVEDFHRSTFEILEDAATFLREFYNALPPRCNEDKGHRPKVAFEDYCAVAFMQDVQNRRYHDPDCADDLSEADLLEAIRRILFFVFIEQVELQIIREIFAESAPLAGLFGIALSYVTGFIGKVADYSEREHMIDFERWANERYKFDTTLEDYPDAKIPEEFDGYQTTDENTPIIPWDRAENESDDETSGNDEN